MTQEQIDALPAPNFQPIRDMVLAIRLTESGSGLVQLPDSLVEKSQVCRVLSVGPGLMLDNGMMRMPPCERGQKIMVTPNDGYPVVVDGLKLNVFEAGEIVGIFLEDQSTGYGADMV